MEDLLWHPVVTALSLSRRLAQVRCRQREVAFSFELPKGKALIMRIHDGAIRCDNVKTKV
jgi:hypothetical protein